MGDPKTSGVMKDRRIVFCRIGWMKEYKGLEGDYIKGGGLYVEEHGYGGEIFNFLSIDGVLWGYVTPPSWTSVNLERIAGAIEGDEIGGVTVVWFANRPSSGQVIVGWYKNATVFRKFQRPSEELAGLMEDNVSFVPDWWVYIIRGQQEDATLLPLDERRFRVPREKHFSGQSNVWYADSEQPEVGNYINEVLNYIDHYSQEHILNSKYFIQGPLPDITMKYKPIDNELNRELSEFKDVLANDPDNFKAMKKIADILTDNERHYSALEYIDNALKLNPKDWELHYWKALCEEGKGQYDKALNSFHATLQLELPPEDEANIYNAIGNLYLNSIEDNLKALDNYEVAIRKNDKDAIFQYNKGITLFNLGRFDEAICSFIRADEIESDDEETLNWIGVAYEELGKYEEAIEYYNKALSCKTNLTNVIENLAILYEKLGLFSKAQDTWRLFKKGNRLLRKAEKAILRLSNKTDDPTSIVHETEDINDLEEPQLITEKITTPKIHHDISKEKYLEEEICRLIKYGLIFDGELEVYEEPGMPYGQQFPTDVGRIDILCKNKQNGSLVVIEIKRAKSADQVIGQISRYMGYVKKKIADPNHPVEGIIVTYGPDKKLEYAVSIHDKIRVFTYSVNITEWRGGE